MAKGELIELGPHENMTPAECLSFCARDQEIYQDVVVVGVDHEGKVFLRSSRVSREWATFLLLEATDKARGIQR